MKNDAPLCQRANDARPQHSGRVWGGAEPLKHCPLPGHITLLLFLNWGLFIAIGTHNETMQRLRLPLLSITPLCSSGSKNTHTQAHTHTHTHPTASVYECNLVLTLSLLWVSVVCCASEMKAGLSNNSEFNTSTSPLMRVPCVCSRLISAAPVGEEARKEGNVVKISH